MKCQKHPYLDAIARCTYCGGGVCEACKTVHNNAIYCQKCYNAGLLSNEPTIDWVRFLYYIPNPDKPGNEVMELEPGMELPSPSSNPEQWPFKVGRIGAAGAAMTNLIMASMPLSKTSGLEYAGPSFWYFFFSMYTISILFLFLFSIGLDGFYKNYGCKTARITNWAIAGASLFVLVVVAYDINTTSGPRHACLLTLYTPLYGDVGLGLGYILSAVAVIRIRKYFWQGTPIWNYIPLLFFGLLVGGSLLVFFPLMKGVDQNVARYLLFPFSWYMISGSMALMAWLFGHVPLPERRIDRTMDSPLSTVQAQPDVR